MSMVGAYIRVTPAELERAVRDPAWASDFADEVRDAEEMTPPAPTAARHFSTYQSWDVLHFLLARAGFPVNVIHGEEPFAEDDDWGYGPPRYLPPARVRLAAQALGATPYDHLTNGVTPADLAKSEVYPARWAEPEVLEWARSWYDGLTQYLTSAAAAGDAVLVWLE
jgi:hypothetical protein